MADSRHTQSIQINRVIGENEKCVFYFTEKKPFRLFGQLSISRGAKLPGGGVERFRLVY